MLYCTDTYIVLQQSRQVSTTIDSYRAIGYHMCTCEHSAGRPSKNYPLYSRAYFLTHA